MMKRFERRRKAEQARPNAQENGSGLVAKPSSQPVSLTSNTAETPSPTSRNSGIGVDGTDCDDNDDRRSSAVVKRNKHRGTRKRTLAQEQEVQGVRRRPWQETYTPTHARSPPTSPPSSPPPPSPKPIAAPRPGYAAPTIATIGSKSPSPSVDGHGHGNGVMARILSETTASLNLKVVHRSTTPLHLSSSKDKEEEEGQEGVSRCQLP
ncbi:hypothetical protein NMY22_g19880 [Coprinellus aureogranulatus]|nr:hypothetical protein NMY22_g19880 [Coprinellus aureogranulatus]